MNFTAATTWQVRSEISRLEHQPLPGGRALWLPVTGKTVTFLGQLGPGKIVHTKEPYTLEEIRILVESVKFDQGLGDSFFSVRKQARVASDEDLRKLQRQLEEAPKPEVKRQPADPESRQKRLDLALDEADRQAKCLEASSAALARRLVRGSLWEFGSVRRPGDRGCRVLVLEETMTVRRVALLHWIILFSVAAGAFADDNRSESEAGTAAPTALYHLIHLEGLSGRLDQVRSALETPATVGHSFRELRQAAGRLGLSLDAIAIPKSLPAIDRPALAFVKSGPEGHFLVIRPVGHTGRLIQVLDGERPPVVLDADRLFASPSWTGLALVPRRPNDFRRAMLFCSVGCMTLALLRYAVCRRDRVAAGSVRRDDDYALVQGGGNENKPVRLPVLLGENRERTGALH